MWYYLGIGACQIESLILMQDLSTRGKYSDDLKSPSRSFSTASLMWFLSRATLCLCGIGCHRLSVCPSVCLFVCQEPEFVPKRLHVGLRSRKQRFTTAQGLYSFMMQKTTTIIYEIPMASPPMGARNANGVGNVAFYDRSRSHRLRSLTTKSLCPSYTVVRDQDGALAEEYAVTSTFYYDASRNLMITVAAQLTSMSRRCYVVSFDRVWCCVEWN